MRHDYFTTIRMTALLAIVAAGSLTAFPVPVAPVNLKAVASGTRVDLAWENGDAGETLLNCDFEGEEFPETDWSVRTTNDYNYICSWFHFPSEDFLQTNNYQDYIHAGQKSAMLYFDRYALKGDHDPAQDEWLVTAPVSGNSYLELYYFIDPMILEYGVNESFPDHYYVKASYDMGETWEVLWDARYEAEAEAGWHSLVLPVKASDSVLLAFQGVSDTNEMIHFLWAIDDVRVCRSTSGSDLIDGYTVKINGETVAEHYKSLEYTDLSDKEPGTYRYEVFAESEGALSLAASADVTVEEVAMLPPASVSVESEFDELDGTYLVTVSWESPAGAFNPVSYNVYCDGLNVGYMDSGNSVSFTGYTKGIYEFSVSAVYSNPEGESECVCQRLAIDTRFNARNLKIDAADGSVMLSWDTPEANDDGAVVSHYEVWRGETCVAEDCTGLSITDSNVPAGHFRYYVTAVYDDGVKALPAYLDFDNGDSAPRSLTFSENFDSGYLPADWRVENLWDETPDNLLWQFGDPNGLGVEGDGFDGGYASIDCLNSGFYFVESALVTPVINVADCDLGSLKLSFTYDYASTGFDSEAAVEIDCGNGEWVRIIDLQSYDPAEDPGVSHTVKEDISLTDVTADEPEIRLRWYYAGMLDYHLAIDNVVISDKNSGVDSAVADSVRVVPSDGGVSVFSAEGIDSIVVYAADGRLLGSENVSGGTQAFVSLDDCGVMIVRVATSAGVHTFKVAR